MLISSPEDEGGVDQTMVFAKAQPKDEDYSDDDDDEETDGDDQDGDDGEPEENVAQADPAAEQDPAPEVEEYIPAGIICAFVGDEGVSHFNIGSDEADYTDATTSILSV